MCPRLLPCLPVVLLLCGCQSLPSAPEPHAQPVEQNCAFALTAEVDGVVVETSTGESRTSVAGQEMAFSLPCAPQLLQLRKPCYQEQRLTMSPEQTPNPVLSRADWEEFGYFRVENDSASEYVEVVNLPDEPLRVPSREHAVRRMPLGDYRVVLSAPYKEPVQHAFRLCAKDEVFSLRVETEGIDGDLVAEGAQSVTLGHGTGQLRVVTEAANLSFRITPDRSEAIRRYLDKASLGSLADLELDQVPQGLRRALALLQRLDSESFRAPVAITLPAGRYFISHNFQVEGQEPIEVEVRPKRETRVEI